ncbi:hypothetical protein MLD38_004628 [Melastoma candidum]|uniref:Uncharacterized protein n=1 Tax=Melastoma candidum TaxID=119954 RepID=A0ACB9S741_9MYRT|nr:hypothetical protein MLD38_004628 [Melastoma candidum]
MPVVNGPNEEIRGSSWWEVIFGLILDVSIPCCVGRPLLYLFDHPPVYKTVTGTIICPPNNGKVKIFMQNDGPEGCSWMVLELPISTSYFAVMLRSETNRILFSRREEDSTWEMSYNGKGVGLMLRKEKVTEEDAKLLETIGSVTTGVGLIPDKSGHSQHKYLRGQFERSSWSDGSEAYHLVDPFGCFGQELSLFFH